MTTVVGRSDGIYLTGKTKTDVDIDSNPLSLVATATASPNSDLHNFAVVTGTAGDDFIHVAGDGNVPPAGYTDIPTATNAADTIDTGSGNDIVFAGRFMVWRRELS